MNIYILIDFLNLILAVYLGIIVYTKDPLNNLNRIFYYNCILIAYTTFCEYFKFTSGNIYWAFFWYKASFLWPFFPFAFIKFVLALTDNKLYSNKKLNYALVLTSILIASIHLFTGVLDGEVIHFNYGWDFAKSRSIYAAFIGSYISLSGILALWLAVKYYLKIQEKKNKNLIRYAVIGFILPYLTGFITEGLIPLLGYKSVPLASLSFMIGTSFIAIGLLRYKLFIPDPLATIKKVFASINDLVVIVNENQKIIMVSKSFCDCTLYEERELLNEKLEKIFDSSLKDPKSQEYPFGQEIESSIVTKTENTIPISVVVSKISDYIQTESLYLLIGRDLRERKNYEDEINNSLEKEKELNLLKSGFISAASHEFRTPLTLILTSADLLELYGRSWPEKKYFEYVTNIQSAVEYMTKLIDDVLTINKSEIGKIVFHPTEINLFKLISDIINSIKLSANKNVNINFNYKLNSHYHCVDGKLINQIVTNILSNAIKYSPAGGTIDMIIDMKEEKLLLSVIDEGIGISKDDLLRLFEPFHRGQNVGTIPGTGLGMSITKKAVEIHQGEIFVQSELNKGTKFDVVISLSEISKKIEKVAVNNNNQSGLS